MSLKSTLQTLLDAARQTGLIHEIKLQRGLVIAIKSNSKVTELQLRRRDGKPSVAEWRTVVNNWPEPMPRVEPHWEESDGRVWLRSSWKTPAKLIEVKPVVNHVESS